MSAAEHEDQAPVWYLLNNQGEVKPFVSLPRVSAPTCATCRFLGAPADLQPAWDDEVDDPPPTEHRRCARIIHGNGDRRLPYSRLSVEPALVTDGSGYAARLIVLPTFGCSLHEERAT